MRQAISLRSQTLRKSNSGKNRSPSVAEANENTPPTAGYNELNRRIAFVRQFLKKTHNDLLEKVEFSAEPGVGPNASMLKRDISTTSGVDHVFFSVCCGSAVGKDAPGVDCVRKFFKICDFCINIIRQK